jgi:hypothetical protein
MLLLEFFLGLVFAANRIDLRLLKGIRQLPERLLSLGLLLRPLASVRCWPSTSFPPFRPGRRFLRRLAVDAGSPDRLGLNATAQ